jgi:hypothetical protein
MQCYRKQMDVARFAVFLCTLFLLLPLDRTSAAIPKVQGSFTRFVADFKFVAEKNGAYMPPTKKEQVQFRSALTSLLKGNVSRAQNSVAPH